MREGSIRVAIDGWPVRFSGAQPIVMRDCVLVPLRGVFERMGAAVDWKPEIRTALIRRGPTRIEMTLAQAMVNGNVVAMEVPPIVRKNSILVPLRFVNESLGAFVDWDPASNLVSISSKRDP